MEARTPYLGRGFRILDHFVGYSLEGLGFMQMGLEERMISSDEEDDAEAQWGDWTEEFNSSREDLGSSSGAQCLICSTVSNSAEQAFLHCAQDHGLDFTALRLQSQLDFYSAMRLLNFIRSEVASRRCWNCGLEFGSSKELVEHLNSTRHSSLPVSDCWKDDKYLTPFLENDSLLYSFEGDLETDMELDLIDKDDIMKELEGFNLTEQDNASLNELVADSASTPPTEMCTSSDEPAPLKKTSKTVSFANVAKEEIRSVNSKYFSSYGEYGIHREMLGDKVRTEAYQKALSNNPGLLENSVVMDIGCGTGILSLFAAKAGAAKVIAIDGSEKMAVVARQVAKENGFIRDDADSNVVEVIGGMIEELDSTLPVEAKSVDIIISEWMGYCLLYESMLGSVLHARDKWLKPGGAILPDTAELFVAGFGRGGTSLGFWENVYGFSMIHIGNEVAEHAAETPLIDVLNEKDIVTDSCSIQKLDIVTMKAEDVDFNAEFELKPRSENLSWCHGVVIWFDVGFTQRFCKLQPVTLTTSPFSPSTHWSQTLLTFAKPIALSGSAIESGAAEVGTEANPALSLKGRISIARSYKHRSIDVSLETIAVGCEGQIFVLPIQIFGI